MSDPVLEHSHEPRKIAERLARGPSVSYLRDWVYGGIDRAITNFAIVAGVIGANLSNRVVLILGIVNVLADGFSMAAANFSGEEIRQIYRAKGFSGADLDRAVAVITAERGRWIGTMMAEEHGLPAVTCSPWKAALVTFAAFLMCGLVPIAPFALSMQQAVPASVIMTAAVFFLIGSVRSLWSPRRWWQTGLETFAIATSAAAVAYAAGDFLRDLL